MFGPILQVDNAGAGKTAIIKPGLDATYDKFVLHLGGGLVAADLTEIRMYANGAEFFKDTGTYLDNRQAFHGIDTDAAEVTIDFTDPNLKGDVSLQYAASLPANLLKQLRIEVDIADAQGVGEDFSLLTCSAEYRGRTQNPFILKRRKFTQYFGAAGEWDLSMPVGENGGVIKRIWLHDGGNVTALQLRVGQTLPLEYDAIAKLTRMQERNGKVIQAGITCLDFVVDGNLNGVLDTSKIRGAVSMRLTTDQAQTVTGYIDYVDPITRISV